MRLHILGCGDAFGSGGRQQSAYLVEASDRLFLLDCGPTALLAMKRGGFDPRRLDAIFLSHLHGDHFGGVPFFLIDHQYRKPRSKPLIIAGPPNTEERVHQLYGTMYGGGPTRAENLPCVFQPLDPGKRHEIAGIEVFPFSVPHQTREISLGLKVAYQGKQILFSGDSPWIELFVDLARGVDLFICECSFYSEPAGSHVHYEALKANFPRLECRQLILVHLGEEMLTRKNDVAMKVAEDGMVIEL